VIQDRESTQPPPVNS